MTSTTIPLTSGSNFCPVLRNGIWHFPIHHMRGGTSTGIVIWERMAPKENRVREELLRHIMGVPAEGYAPGNRQTAGLGRGSPTSNKVFFADVELIADARPRLISTLAQLAADHGRIDWSVNCGNMSSALQLWAVDMGFIDASPGAHAIDIRNTNTDKVMTSRMAVELDGRFAETQIPGVLGRFPAVDLVLRNPVGAKTGMLLPTGAASENIDGYLVSCVDVAVPMVIARASDFGKTAHEPLAELAGDLAFLGKAKEIWVEAGQRMRLKRKDGVPMSRDELARSETIPKFCIVGEPRFGADLSVRYFTPQSLHASLAVSGGCCLAAATLIPGSVAHDIAGKTATPGVDEVHVAIENPAGTLETTVIVRRSEDGPTIAMAAYRRSAQVLLKGFVPLYNASAALASALDRQCGSDRSDK
ncbi:MAG TPA: PrpF domain-containing protein [Trinickia sp.]|uniref:PrpF domain-containing protein n=1 Tax=Trinickia sp. TaxID=2571163 RepID=UPI002BF5AAC2|nr:PrpF domain-containing protein [Trinickia sp.]HTI16637.1 PrpF domain-containing protein [Trinickia sp.]